MKTDIWMDFLGRISHRQRKQKRRILLKEKPRKRKNTNRDHDDCLNRNKSLRTLDTMGFQRHHIRTMNGWAGTGRRASFPQAGIARR